MGKIDDLVLKHKNGEFTNEQIAGFSDEEIKEFVNKVIKGGVAIKACAFTALKKYA